ncbi:MAG: ABC transporter substrate-binding protein, partial [Tissierellales bacterium]|nr:ABC transporter substrate-binding protein [Tissierellales bacterium]
ATLILVSVGCSPQSGPKPDEQLQEMTFTLDWFPNTNHTGIYVAKSKGYFEEEGFDVEIIQPGESSAEQLVATGTAQFGISYQESTTFARAEGIPVVSVAAVIQHNSSGFMALKEKEINSPKDFEDKKYGGWGSPIELATIQYLMEQENADASKVEIVTIGDIDFFAASQSGDVDFAWVFEGWSVLEAKIKGFDVQYIDLGKEAEVFDYYTPIIITSEKNIAENKEMVEKFMRAVKKGYEFAVENPEESARILLESVPELSEELVLASQEFLSSRYIDDAPYWGYQEKETWDRYTQWLFEHQFITSMIDTEAAFTNEFLE